MKHSFALKTIILVALVLISSFAATATIKVNALSSSGLNWRLLVTGLVNQPLNLTLSDLKAMPQITEEGTIYCVSFPDQIVTTGIWKGVSLSALLTQVDVEPSVVKVAFFAADGYTTDLDVTTAMNGNVIVAYEKDGLPLGETLRLVVPGKWGYKWISQLTEISLVDFDFKGTYESQGYSDETATVGSQTGPSPVDNRAIQTIPNSTQTTKTEVPSSTLGVNNSTDWTPLQNTQNSHPELKSQPSSSLQTTVEVITVAGVTACVALLILVTKHWHLRKVKLGNIST